MGFRDGRSRCVASAACAAGGMSPMQAPAQLDKRRFGTCFPCGREHGPTLPEKRARGSVRARRKFDPALRPWPSESVHRRESPDVLRSRKCLTAVHLCARG
jgi:hypothetical protein